MLIKDIMTLSPVATVLDDSVMQAAEMMHDWDVGLLPVVESQIHKRLLGVISDRDIVVRCIAAGQSAFCRVADHMTKAPIATVYAEASVDQAIDTMKRRKVRRLPVVDENEVVVGMITQADIARHVAPQTVGELLQTISEPVETEARV